MSRRLRIGLVLALVGVLAAGWLYECEQLQGRGHFVETAHEIFETTTVESTRLHLSRAKPQRPAAALSVGRDNRLVLESILAYGPEQVDRLLASDAMR